MAGEVVAAVEVAGLGVEADHVAASSDVNCTRDTALPPSQIHRSGCKVGIQEAPPCYCPATDERHDQSLLQTV